MDNCNVCGQETRYGHNALCPYEEIDRLTHDNARLSAANAELVKEGERLREVYEEYAGMEGVKTVTPVEEYLMMIIRRMADLSKLDLTRAPDRGIMTDR